MPEADGWDTGLDGSDRGVPKTALVEEPEVFDKGALVRELGYRPARSTFYRALEELLRDRKIVIDSHSGGRTMTKYRRAGGPKRREA